MPNSMAQQAELNCSNCHQTFTADIWLIIDTQERPDLLTQLQARDIHNLPCPHCQKRGQVDAPLLIYRPDNEPVILFSPAQQTSQKEDQEQAIGLINSLRQQLGPAWQDAWLAEDLSSVPLP